MGLKEPQELQKPDRVSPGTREFLVGSSSGTFFFKEKAETRAPLRVSSLVTGPELWTRYINLSVCVICLMIDVFLRFFLAVNEWLIHF